MRLKNFEFMTHRGRLGALVLVPGNPPEYYWTGRGECPDEVRDSMTRGINDPETGKRVGADAGDEFIEVLQLSFARGQQMAGRKGVPLEALPAGARKVAYTPGIANIFG